MTQKETISEFCRQRFIVRAMYGVQFKDGKRTEDLMMILYLNETIDQLVMASSLLASSGVEDGGWSCLEGN